MAAGRSLNGGALGRREAIAVLVFAAMALLAGLTAAPASGAPGDLRFASCIEDPTGGECNRDFDGLDGVGSLALSPDGRDLYAVSFRRTAAPVGGDSALVHLRRNKRTGRLRPVSCTQDADDVPGGPTCPNTLELLDGPIDVVVSPNGRHVYVLAYLESALLHFKRNRRSGRLTYVRCLDDAGLAPIYDVCPGGVDGMGSPNDMELSRDGRSLYVTSSIDDSIVSFRVNRKSGRLRPLGCLEDADRTLFDDCPDPGIEGLASPSGLVVHPNGRTVYVAAFDDDAVTWFRRNKRTGKLRFAGCLKNRGTASDDDCAERASGIPDAGSVGISPDGRFVYVGATNDGAMAEFRVRKDGSLKYKRCVEVPFSPEPCATVAQRLGRSADFAFDPRGRAMFVAGGQGIQPFRRNPRTGELTELPCIDDDEATSTATACQRTSRNLLGTQALLLSPDGRFLYAAATTDDAISVFRHRR